MFRFYRYTLLNIQLYRRQLLHKLMVHHHAQYSFLFIMMHRRTIIHNWYEMSFQIGMIFIKAFDYLI